jgi:hypothetical protein
MESRKAYRAEDCDGTTRRLRGSIDLHSILASTQAAQGSSSEARMHRRFRVLHLSQLISERWRAASDTLRRRGGSADQPNWRVQRT